MNEGTANSVDRDLAVLDLWWRHFVTCGELPPFLNRVQGRLIRTVVRGELPSGPVFVKAMTFPRMKDQLRYSLRSLPALHEAAMLRAVAQAVENVPCPEVLLALTQRRFGLPFRSMLVLRAMPVVVEQGRSPRALFVERAGLAKRLLDAGFWHRDLHAGNFVRLDDGRLGILDLQSMRRIGKVSDRCDQPLTRDSSAAVIRAGRGMAANLLLDRAQMKDDDALLELTKVGLVPEGDRAVFSLARQQRLQHQQKRILRCFATTTEFVRTGSIFRSECRLRAAACTGPVIKGRDLRACWLGQRLLSHFEGRAPVLAAFSFGITGEAVQWQLPCSATEQATELQILRAASARYAWLWRRDPWREFDDFVSLRTLRDGQSKGP
ncbi:MAG: phosphotransferase [Planctomycetota bacterium]|nr:phosphotransferase [Planctomycetota bacterium]